MGVEWFPGNLRMGVLRCDDGAPEHRGDTPVEPKILFILMCSGRQSFRLGGTRIDMQAPSAVALHIRRPMPMAPISGAGPVAKIALAMPVDWLDSFDAETQGVFPRPRAALQIRRWVPGQDVLMRADALMTDPDRMARMAGAVGLLHALLAEARHRGPLDSPARIHEAPLGDGVARDAQRVQMVRTVLARHHGGPLTAADVAGACGLSLRTLERSWRRAQDIPLGTHIRETLLRAGLVLLARSSTTVAEAAWASGFSNPCNFATAIRDRFGMSPTALRQKIQAGQSASRLQP